MTWRTDYEVQPTIDANQAARNMAPDGWKGDYHRIASIPLNVFHDQLAEASRQGDDKYLNRWLNDSETVPGAPKQDRSDGFIDLRTAVIEHNRTA